MTQDIEKYVEEFYSKWTHDQLGSYADHAPAYTHPEGECTICPVQVWYQDDIAHWLRATLTKVAEEARQEERERIVEYVQKAYCTQEHKDKHYCGFNDGEQVCDCYNEALDDLITHLSDK